LKFVMSSDADSPYNNVPQWAHDWKVKTGKEIYCSPMNVYNSFPQKIKLLRAEKGNITMAERSTVDEVISFWEPGLLDLKANQANHEYAAHYCIEHGFKLNLQMHLYASLA
jgi:7-carboxy-7-deazaguanine synthase